METSLKMTISKIILLLAMYSSISASCDAPFFSGNKVDKAALLGEFSQWRKQRIDFASEHYSDTIEPTNSESTKNTVLSKQTIDQLGDIFSILKSFSGKRIIFPGTKWCGDGNIAENYDDLGLFEGTDRCCRAHDNCEPSIDVGQTAYGLTNDGFLIRKDCECDIQFSSCLSEERSNVSSMIGMMYFTFLQNKCFTYNQTCYANSTSDRMTHTEPNDRRCQFCHARPFKTDVTISDVVTYLSQLIKNDQ